MQRVTLGAMSSFETGDIYNYYCIIKENSVPHLPNRCAARETPTQLPDVPSFTLSLFYDNSLNLRNLKKATIKRQRTVRLLHAFNHGQVIYFKS